MSGLPGVPSTGALKCCPCQAESAQRSGVGNHARDLGVVTIGNEHGTTELALHFWRLGRQDVTRLRLATLDFAGASLAEALLRARMGLQLGHFLLFVRRSELNQDSVAP